MTGKRIGAAVAVAILMLTTCFHAAAAGGEGKIIEEESIPAAAVQLALPCKAALLMCSDTGDVIYEMNADEKLAMASITKVMTLLLTFEALEAGKVHLDDLVPVSEHTFSMGGSQIWLEPGEQFTLEEMIKAICVSSANDAAVAVAEYIGGSEQSFVAMMNARAQELGMVNTCFKNACGLDEDGHYSTAREVAIMSLALMKHTEVFHYSQIWTDTLRNGETMLTNTNKLLRSYNGITGLKTGTTGKAGVCISATAVRDGMGLIAVTLGSNSSKERFEAASTLLDYGFAGFECAPFPDTGDLPKTIAVKGGIDSIVALECQMPKSLLLKKGESGQLRAESTIEESVSAPVHAGQEVGRITLYIGENVMGSYPVIACANIEKMNFSLALQLLWKGVYTM